MKSPAILLADDHTILLQALQALLTPEFDVVGTATDGRTLVSETMRLKPDLVVLDIAMPLLGGLEAGRQIKAQRKDTRLVYLTMNADPEMAAEALRIGALGYVLKVSAGSELRMAIRQALDGRAYITPLITRDVVDSLIEQRKRLPALTSRQCEVLQLLAEGRSMKEVGALLNLTPRTVAFHKYRMMEQLRVRSSAELVRFAVKHGVVA